MKKHTLELEYRADIFQHAPPLDALEARTEEFIIILFKSHS
jgi:hypothetical protein